MRYEVRTLDDEVRGTINSWNLPRPVLLAALCHLTDDVASDPDQYLTETIIPLGETYVYSFTLAPGDLVQKAHWFVFHIQRNDLDKRLYIVDAKCVINPAE